MRNEEWQFRQVDEGLKKYVVRDRPILHKIAEMVV